MDVGALGMPLESAKMEDVVDVCEYSVKVALLEDFLALARNFAVTTMQFSYHI